MESHYNWNLLHQSTVNLKKYVILPHGTKKQQPDEQFLS